jgi:CRP-like cAMP-binding protein
MMVRFMVPSSLDFLGPLYYAGAVISVVVTTKNGKERRLFMEEMLGMLAGGGLFEGVSPEELRRMLQCLGARIDRVKRGEVLLLAGERPESVGIVLEGELHVERDDADGNRSLLAALGPLDLFAEAICCARVEESPVTVSARSDAVVLLLRFSRILGICSNSCAFHRALIANMLRIVAQKNLFLQGRMELLTARGVRGKILLYLSGFAKKGGAAFTVPLNRAEMADHLAVERSALSHELMKMRAEGLLEYQKNRFKLL